MSHTFEFGPAQGDDGVDRVFTVIHNGDWSGDATLIIRTVSTSHSFEMKVPGVALKSLAAEMLRDELVDLVQNWDPTEGM